MPEPTLWDELSQGWPGTAFTPDVRRAEWEERTAPWGSRAPEYGQMLSDARSLLLLEHHFYGRLAMRLRFVLTEAIDTAAIRADAVCFFNPHFLEELGPEERAFVIAHEICHLWLGHFERRGTRDPYLFNVACDLTINPLLLKSGLRVPARESIKPLMLKRVEDQSAEQIYDYVQRELRAGRSLRGVLRGDDGAGCRGGMGTSTGDCDFAATDVLRERSVKGSGDRVLSAAEWRDLVIVAAAAARAMGQLSAGVERLVGDLAQPRLPWSAVLARLTARTLAPGTSWRRPSRRSAAVRRRVLAASGARTALPGRTRDPDPVVVAIDTSGSMSKEEIRFALSETRGILAQYNRPIRVLCCDAAVHVDEDIRDVHEIQPTGGGGTSAVPVFDRLAEEPGNWGPPAALIYFSDMGIFGYPEATPSYPVFWVATGRCVFDPPPFGTVIEYHASL